MSNEEQQQNKNTKPQRNIQKKFFIYILILIFFIYFINCLKTLPKYRFGYIFKGPRATYHKFRENNVFFKLKNGNIFILGKNTGDDHSYAYQKEDRIIPSEIYNIKTNKIEPVSFPMNIKYHDNAILLEDNKLLLILAYDPNLPEYKSGKSFPYDSMAVVNLDNMKIEKMIKKKVNEKNKPFPNPGKIYLGNNKVIVSNELFDIDKGTSKILKEKNLEKGFRICIPTKENKMLIFVLTSTFNKEALYDNVYEYNYVTEELKQVGKITKRDIPYIKKVSDDKIVIIGGTKPNENFTKLSEIEVYDINTNESKVISNMRIERCTNGWKSGFDVDLFDKKYLFIIGGKCLVEKVYGVKTDKRAGTQSEIVNLETNANYLGPKVDEVYLGQNIIKLNNDNLLIAGSGGDIQIFKQWGK